MTDHEQKQTVVRQRVQAPREPSRETVIEQRRVRNVTSLRPYLALLLIMAGIAVLMTELFRYWLRDIAIGGAPVAIGALFAFVGFFLLDSKDALVGAKFVVDSFTQVVGTIRTGRRSTDRRIVVDPEATQEMAVPVPPPAPPVDRSTEGG